MTEEFDPYLKWLGIAPQEQPPNHYRLLGIPLFVDDPDVIVHGADRQMAHVRTFQTGKHSSISQRVLNELSTARICLLNADRKAAYDAQLRAKLAPPPAPTPPSRSPVLMPATRSMLQPASAAPAPSDPLAGMSFDTDSRGSRNRTSRKTAVGKPPWLLPVAITAAVLAVVGIVAMVLTSGGNAPSVAKKDDDRPAPTNESRDPPTPEIHERIEPKPSQALPATADTAATKPLTSPAEVVVSKPLAVPPPAPQNNTKGAAPPPAKAPFDAAQAIAFQQAWAKSLGVPVETTNSVNMKLVLIPPGEFLMGATPDEIQRVVAMPGAVGRVIRSEGPQHQVKITRPFYCGATEVTCQQYRTFAAATGRDIAASNATDDWPVAEVTWDDAAHFCNWLSAQEQLDPAYNTTNGARTPLPGNGYHLPTEAQWEFACRAGTVAAFLSGDEAASLDDFAWHKENSNGGRHPVMGRTPNQFQLFDTLGNVFEWCQDVHSLSAYSDRAETDPQGPGGEGHRPFRGGGWNVGVVQSRCTFRGYNPPTLPSNAVGFRVVRALATTPAATGTSNSLGDTVNLVDAIDLQKDVVAGNWQRVNGELISPSTIDARFYLPKPPAPDYTVSVTVKRLDGDHLFFIGLVIDGRQVLAGIDFRRTGSGLDLIDGKWIGLNETRHPGTFIHRDRSTVIRCTVQGHRIVVMADDIKLVDWTGDPKRLSLFPEIAVPDKSRLFIGSHCSFSISRITVEGL